LENKEEGILGRVWIKMEDLLVLLQREEDMWIVWERMSGNVGRLWIKKLYFRDVIHQFLDD
jgi:hypothetical protein